MSLEGYMGKFARFIIVYYSFELYFKVTSIVGIVMNTEKQTVIETST